MLIRQRAQRGVTLIELLIGIAILVTLLAVGMPSFSAWIQNTQIRNAAESIKSGLVFAQTEALRRNTPVRFQLMTSIASDCALSTTKPNWVVNVGDSATNDPSGACGPASDASAPFIIRSKGANEGMRNAVVATSQAVVVFNSYGQVLNMTNASMDIDLSNPTGGTCATANGPMTCMRVKVYQSGQIRMCNPSHPDGSPQGC